MVGGVIHSHRDLDAAGFPGQGTPAGGLLHRLCPYGPLRIRALDWLAQLFTHIPNKGEQMVRYYGYYSNKSRGIVPKRRIRSVDAIARKLLNETSELLTIAIKTLFSK